MKITTITLGETQIEFHHSVFGKETIIVNGEEVSCKKSMTGTEHLFDVVEGEATAKYKLITGINLNGVAIDLYKDDKPIIQSPRAKRWKAFILMILIGVLGYYALNGIISQ